MATIRSVFSPGATFNVLDPNAWVGGVVPGPNDIAQIGENGDYRALINMDRAPYSTYNSPFSGSTIVKNQGSVIFPWEGNDVTIPVNSNAYNFNSEYQWPDTNGSFLVHSMGNFPADIRFPIKIDYVSKSLDNTYTFQSCSVDRTFNNWIYKTGSNSEIYNADFNEKGYPKETTGIIRYNDYVYPLHTKFELTGSDTWHVGQIETLERCHFTMKENATLKLDGSSVNPNAIYNNQDSHRNEIRILDNSTVELTGSVQRTNAGIYFYNRSGLVQISGSDLCPSTTLSQPSSAGDSTITLTHTSSIGIGNLISIDNQKDPVHYIAGNYSTEGDINPYYYWINPNYSTGSSFRRTGASSRGGLTTFISGNFKEHEVVQVVSQSGHDYTVAKLFGKEGKIQQDLGTYTYEEFVQNFSGSLTTPFEGNKRVVLIDSLHRDFQAGEKLIINKSKVAEVLYTDYYLSSSLFLDFENGATTDAIHTSSYAGYTGSFIDVTTSGNYHLFYNEYYRGSQYWSTSPRTGSNGEFTSSLHVDIPRLKPYYGNNNPRNYSAFIIKNTNFDEGEITVTWDRNVNLYGNADTSGYLGVFCGFGHYHDNAMPTYNTGLSYGIWYAPFRVERDYVYWGARGNDGGSAGITRFFPFSGDRYYRDSNKSRRFSATTHIKKGIAKHYMDNTLLEEQLEVSFRKTPIKIQTYRFNNIFSIEVKDYYQLVLLDTEESFNYKDEVLEGVQLEYNHKAGQRVRTNGNKIKDPLGYYNLVDDLHDNGKDATIKIALQSATTTVAQNGNYNSLYRFWNNYVGGGELNYEFQIPRALSFSYIKAGTGCYAIYDLQTEASMSALSFREYYAYNYDYIERAGEPIQIDVSNDLENWTTVYGPTNDPRYVTRLGQLRFYDFTSGSISARFVKLHMNGNSRTTSNHISYLGLYNFYDENNQDMGNTIELYNADMFEVGDKVFFQEFKRPQGVEARSARYPAVEWDTLPGVSSGTTTDDDVCGGLTFLHTIIAKNGNKITLDRKVANYPIYKDTHVYKWNQGSINFKGNYKNLAVWYNRRQQGDGYSMYQCVNANFDHSKTFTGLDGGGSDNYVLNSTSENLSVNPIDKDGGAGMGGLVEKNNLIAGGGYNISFGSTALNQNATPDTMDVLIFNNVALNYTYHTSFHGIRAYPTFNNWVYTYNLFGPKYTNNSVSSTNNSKAHFTLPKIKYSHNYMAYPQYRGGSEIWSGEIGGWGFKGSLDTLEVKDNNSFIVYEGSYQQSSYLPNQYNEQKKVSQHALHVEQFKNYGYLSNTAPLPYLGWTNGTRTIATNGTYSPMLSISPSSILKQKMLSSPNNQNQPQYRFIKPKENTYSIYQGFYYGVSQSRLYYAIPFIYTAYIKVHQTQDIKFYTEFDYLRPDWWYYKKSINSTNDINRGAGYIMHQQPRILLANALNKNIIDKVELNTTGSNSNALYNKTHTLSPGEYIYGLQSDDATGYGLKLMEHGPIDFNIFSTSPSTVEVYSSNWDYYTLLNDKPYTPIENAVATNKGKFKALRASNTLPTGTIKIRTLKL